MVNVSNDCDIADIGPSQIAITVDRGCSLSHRHEHFPETVRLREISLSYREQGNPEPAQRTTRQGSSSDAVETAEKPTKEPRNSIDKFVPNEDLAVNFK
jgi:hypothetical protein